MVNCEFYNKQKYIAGGCLDGSCLNAYHPTANTSACCKECSLTECHMACDQSGKAAPKAQMHLDLKEVSNG